MGIHNTTDRKEGRHKLKLRRKQTGNTRKMHQTLAWVILLLLCSIHQVTSFSVRHPSRGRQHTATTKRIVPLPAESQKPAQINFSKPGSNNKIDNPLTWLFVSDIGSLVLGSLGLLVLLVGRLFLLTDNSDAVNPAETRENLLIVIAVGGVLLNGLTQLNVESATAPMVPLDGIPVRSDTPDTNTTTTWVLQSVLFQPPVCSAVLLERNDDGWTVVDAAGIVPRTGVVAPTKSTPLLNKAASSRTETSLPSLQALPAKQELITLLPPNTPAALLIPCRKSGLLIVGSNRARSFTPNDTAWCVAAASRL